MSAPQAAARLGLGVEVLTAIRRIARGRRVCLLAARLMAPSCYLHLLWLDALLMLRTDYYSEALARVIDVNAYVRAALRSK